jgi:hypothetical protein
MGNQRGLSKRKRVYLTLFVACGLIFVSLLALDALLPQEPIQNQIQVSDTAAQKVADSYSAIPAVLTMLPVAAVVAYVLEWRCSEKPVSA